MVCLLIDDDPDDQEFFTLALAEIDAKIELVTVNSGIDALAMLRERKLSPDLIFLDINMPRIDGWECLETLKSMEHVRKVPVVIYSTSDNDRGFADAEGVTAFLTKQPKISELSKKLAEIFSKIKG